MSTPDEVRKEHVCTDCDASYECFLENCQLPEMYPCGECLHKLHNEGKVALVLEEDSDEHSSKA